MTAAIEAPEQDGPPLANTREDGTRTYEHKITGETFLSVTTAMKVIAKEALVVWAAKLVASEAMEQLPRLVQAARRKPCGQYGDKRCGVCRDCVTIDLAGRPNQKKTDAGNIGKRVHKAAEQEQLGVPATTVDPEIAGHLEQYHQWLQVFEPRYDATEMTVINRQYGYAGTLDGIVRLGWCPPKWAHLVGKPLVLDIKTSKGVYDEFSLQLAAYANGEAVLLPDSTELPMPEVFGETGLVLHLRPDEPHQTHPVDISDVAFGGFLSALSLYKCMHREERPVGRAMYKRPLPGTTPAPKAAAMVVAITMPMMPA